MCVCVCVCVCDIKPSVSVTIFSSPISQLGYNESTLENGNFHQPEEILSVIDFANYKTHFSFQLSKSIAIYIALNSL